MTMLEARVAEPSPGLKVVVQAESLERVPVRGYPAHPAGRPPQRDDRCVVDYDARGRLFIVSWEVP